MSTKIRQFMMSQERIDAALERGWLEPLPRVEGASDSVYRFTAAGSAALRDVLRSWVG